MLIDWFTVVAQMVNFLILVLLLRRFLYGPIISAMDERQARIEADLALAEQKQAEASQEIESYRQKKAELAERRHELMRQAEEEVERRRHALIDEARRQVDEIRARWYRALEQEQSSFLQALRQRVGHQTYTIARKALADMANAELEQQIIELFLDRLQALPDSERRSMADAMGGSRDGAGSRSGQPIVVHSGFELSEASRRKITRAIHEALLPHQPVDYRRSPDLICGLALKVQGHKIAWNLADYLDELEREVAGFLELEGSD